MNLECTTSAKLSVNFMGSEKLTLRWPVTWFAFRAGIKLATNIEPGWKAPGQRQVRSFFRTYKQRSQRSKQSKS